MNKEMVFIADGMRYFVEVLPCAVSKDLACFDVTPVIVGSKGNYFCNNCGSLLSTNLIKKEKVVISI